MFRPIAVAIAWIVTAVLSSCARTENAPSPRSAAQPSFVAGVANGRASVVAVNALPAPEQAKQMDAQWPVAVMQDPDPRVRRFALEQWARNPTESLDLVAAAMVDPEATIRERAEQIFEDALARRR